MNRWRNSVRALAFAAVLTVGLGAAGAAPGHVQAPSKVGIVLKEWKVLPSSASVAAGKVTFQVRNTGAIEHELVVLRSDRRPNALPVKSGAAVETGLRGEIAKVSPGQQRTLTLNLKPGKYVLICNLLGHYKAGQYAALRVS